MSDPFWDELNASLPRAARGEAAWSHRRSRVLAALRGGPAPRRAARALAFGLAAAALLVALVRRSPPPAHVPSEDIEFLESAELLENLDELIDSPELDNA